MYSISTFDVSTVLAQKIVNNSKNCNVRFGFVFLKNLMLDCSCLAPFQQPSFPANEVCQVLWEWGLGGGEGGWGGGGGGSVRRPFALAKSLSLSVLPIFFVNVSKF